MHSTLAHPYSKIPVAQLIIDRPDLQPRQHRAAFAVVTAMFWLLWVLLWLPLITLLGWAFFGYQLHFQMFALDGYRGVLDVLGIYALVILVMGASLMVWAKYNHLRFRGIDRRRDVSPPTPAELAPLHGCTPQDIGHWQGLHIVTVHHDSDGRIQRVDG